MAEIAKCLVCGMHDVATISILSSSGNDVTLRFCVGHEKQFQIGITSILLRMSAEFRDFAAALGIDGDCDTDDHELDPGTDG
jgi:hypothetical protein